MGAVESRVHSSPLANLCRERKELIRAAIDSRYCLATAHVVYFHSLRDLCSALNRFVEEELVVVAESSGDEASTDENSHAECVSKKSSPMETLSPTYQRPGFVPITMKGLKLQSFLPGYVLNGNGVSSSADCDIATRNDIELRGSQTNGGVLRTSADIPSDSRHEHDQQASIGMHCAETRCACDSCCDVMGTQGDTAFLNGEITAAAMGPSPGVLAWDFLGLFNANDCVDFNHYDDETDDIEHGMLRGLGEEGLPPLEDESKQTEFQEKPGSEVADAFKQATTPVSKRKLKKICNDSAPREKITQDHQLCEDLAKEELARGEKNEAIIEGNDDSYYGSKDLGVVVREIWNASETAVDNAKGVSALLEAARQPYHTLGDKFKEFFTSRILERASSSRCSINRMFGRPISASKMAKDAENLEGYSSIRNFGSLSSTLESLYEWEKKLYKEVMVEEKLRQEYNREYRILKKLDESGAEASKIDSAHASVKKLRPEITVAITAIDTISRRIQKIRDEELQFQLSAIMQEFSNMWRVMAKCHEMQLVAIRGSKSYLHMAEADSRHGTSFKATQKLEADALRFRKSLAAYIDGQKKFARLLNEWLLRCIASQESHESNVSNPPVFTMCNDWHLSMERLPENEIMEAMHDFASRLHHLKEMQSEEARQRVRTEQIGNMLEGEVSPTRGNLDADGSEEMAWISQALEAERKRHAELVRELNDTVTACLQASVASVFQALAKFSLESSKAYQQIRHG